MKTPQEWAETWESRTNVACVVELVEAVRKELLAQCASDIRKEAETVSQGEWRDGMEEAADMLDPA